MDVLKPEQRRRCMAAVRSKHTGPERALRSALWHTGLRYRIHSSLPGKPDLLFPGSHLAIFVDGCFWHSCPLHATTPQTNRGFWEEKLARNRSRDRIVDERLQALGYRVVRIWQHDIEKGLGQCVQRIRQAVRNEFTET